MDAQILAVLKLHWKRFVWAWVFPCLVFGALLVPEVGRYPRLLFFGIGLPIFFWCYYVASKPVRERRVTIAQGMILIVLAPIIIWATLIFGIFGLAILTGGAR